jgi:uncharacterized membrane protein
VVAPPSPCDTAAGDAPAGSGQAPVGNASIAHTRKTACHCCAFASPSRSARSRRGRFSSATGINDRGQIVGDRFDFDRQTIVATLWENGQAATLPTLSGSNGCRPTAINQRGVVVGWCAVVVQDGFSTQAPRTRARRRYAVAAAQLAPG